MTKVVSQKQRSANRRNAKRSTGPQTTHGRNQSAANALKHGLLARNVVLTAKGSTESRDEFNRLLRDFVDDLKPTSVLEQTLVERIATCYWRLHRAQRYEVDALQDGIAEPPKPSEKLIDNLSHQLQHCDETLKIVNRIVPLLRKPPRQLTPVEAANVNEGLEKLAERWANIPTDRTENPGQIRNRLFGLAETCTCDAVQLQIRLRAAELERTPSVHRKRMNAALPHGDNLSRVIRYETMLDRQLHRAIAELNKLRRASISPNVAPTHAEPQSEPKSAVWQSRSRRGTLPESDTA